MGIPEGVDSLSLNADSTPSSWGKKFFLEGHEA